MPSPSTVLLRTVLVIQLSTNIEKSCRTKLQSYYSFWDLNVKKYYSSAEDYISTVVHRTHRNNYISASVYGTIAWDLEKIQSTSTDKHFISDYSTTMVHGSLSAWNSETIVRYHVIVYWKAAWRSNIKSLRLKISLPQLLTAWKEDSLLDHKVAPQLLWGQSRTLRPPLMGGWGVVIGGPLYDLISFQTTNIWGKIFF